MQRPPTGGRRPPGTGAGRGRLAGAAPRTGMASRSGLRSRAGAGMPAAAGQIAGELASQLNVKDRPITQQGLAAPKTGVRGPERGVYDKTYYMGLLRGKISELKQAVRELNSQTDSFNTDQATYMTATKQAEELAAQLKHDQGTLTDLNLIVEMLNTNSDMSEIGRKTARQRAANDREAHDLETLFMERSRKEQEITELEADIEREKSTAETIVSEMSTEMRDRYQELRAINEQQNALRESQQREMDEVHDSIQQLEEELSQYPMKMKAAKLQQQVVEEEGKTEAARKDFQRKMKETPEEERARLLEQVRKNNQELSGMEKLMAELQQKKDVLQDQLQEMESKFDEEFDEKLAQFKKLSDQQTKLTVYLTSFPERLQAERDRKAELQSTLASKLEASSRRIEAAENLPTTDDLHSMQDELNYKVEAMEHSGSTSEDLEKEHEQLKQTLAKFSATEKRLVRERDQLKIQQEKLAKELAVCSDIDGLKQEAERRRRKLLSQKGSYEVQTVAFKQRLQLLVQWSDEMKAKLDVHDTHKQLTNWERQWQQKVANNYTMKEYIATRSSETNYQPIVEDVKSQLAKHNEDLTRSLGKQLTQTRALRDY